MRVLVVAVDVGTGSARAGVLDREGALLGRAESPLDMNRPAAGFAEHDSEQVWAAACTAVRAALRTAEARPEEVAGIGFDATCSLVVRDRTGRPLAVSPGGDPRWDTIAWLDHRAIAEAKECTAGGHRVLDHIGGVMSPEMETPKLMWLQRHVPESWRRAGHLFDLADFLTWKACGSLERSQSTLTCKWTHLAHEETGWQPDFFAAMGIPDVLDRGQLPARASPVGRDLGSLTAAAAGELGLTTRCRVGVGLIDAHAGALGALGGLTGNPGEIHRHLALVAGTSSCVVALSRDARPIRGVWGPYYGAVLGDCWLNEAGQSATGALLDHVIRRHGGEPDLATHRRIGERIGALRAEQGLNLGRRLHVLPDFHGNRSPLADPEAVGVISGLTLDHSFDSLCILYWRTAVAIALGVRHVLEALRQRGYGTDTLHAAGGHTRSPLLMELYADATGCRILTSVGEDTVLLGTGMVAAAAAGLYGSLPSACAGMAQGTSERRPDPRATRSFDQDYRVFLAMHEHRRAIDEITSG